MTVVPTAPVAAADLTPFEGTPNAPELALPDLTGRVHDLRAYRGRAVVVNFWASWCAPCLREFPSMNRAQAALAGSGVVFLAVNAGQRRGIVDRFAKRFDIGFPVLLDDGGAVSRRWHAVALPVSYVIDPAGKVVLGVVGAHDWNGPATRRRLAAVAAGAE